MDNKNYEFNIDIKKFDELKGFGTYVAKSMLDNTGNHGILVIPEWYYDNADPDVNTFNVLQMDWGNGTVDDRDVEAYLEAALNTLIEDIVIHEKDVCWDISNDSDIVEQMNKVDYNVYIRKGRIATLIRLGAPMIVLKSEVKEWLQAVAIQKYGKLVKEIQL